VIRPADQQHENPEAVIKLAAIEPLAVDAEQAAVLLGMSRSMFYKMTEAGQIGPIGRRFGKCVRYSLAELRSWSEAGMPPRHLWQAMREHLVNEVA